MTGFSDITWLLLAGIAGFGVLQMLRSLAIRVRNEVAVHDLNIKVAGMKKARVEELMIRHGIEPHADDEPGEAEFAAEIPDDSASGTHDETDIGSPPERVAA